MEKITLGVAFGIPFGDPNGTKSPLARAWIFIQIGMKDRNESGFDGASCTLAPVRARDLQGESMVIDEFFETAIVTTVGVRRCSLYQPSTANVAGFAALAAVYIDEVLIQLGLSGHLDGCNCNTWLLATFPKPALIHPWLWFATVMQKPHPFADRLKRRKDVEVIEVTRENRDTLPGEIVEKIKARLEAG